MRTYERVGIFLSLVLLLVLFVLGWVENKIASDTQQLQITNLQAENQGQKDMIDALLNLVLNPDK